MPLLTLHLLSLKPGIKPESVAQSLRKAQGVEVIVASRPRGFVVRPEILDVPTLLNTKWDLLLLLRSSGNGIPADLHASFVKDEYTVHAGIPSRLLSTYPEKNARLWREAPSAPLTGALDEARGKPSSQNLELSPALFEFMDELVKVHDKSVTMLNLLHFHKDGKPHYYKYGQGFIPVAGKRGGDAKIVGNVVKPGPGQCDSRGDANKPEDEWWNEISIVHYPSIRHFCDMLAGADYQEINAKYRLGALRDTFLLCTTELDIEGPEYNTKL
ncbi:hypothetical protein AJ80_00027 [Polytolypa hystricis UAMH7299]|uniref:Uncharacterized protein n=1 Tax=Polytolypa hystricis (strain UAMH7299) TaxID=1447883 RepID=A0A2B7Z5K9_POLH7|nr:hypothetical protein AJ80_00027 [Polytolypa hystricis UAMH7299]